MTPAIQTMTQEIVMLQGGARGLRPQTTGVPHCTAHGQVPMQGTGVMMAMCCGGRAAECVWKLESGEANSHSANVRQLLL